MLIRCRGESILVTDQDGTDLSSRVPMLKRVLGRIRARQAMFDGTLVCVDDRKRPSKKLLACVLAGEDDREITF